MSFFPHVNECPACGVNLQGRTLGHEVPDVYDGILFWSCLGCGHAWPRHFPAQSPRARQASDHAAVHNAAEAGPCRHHPDEPAVLDGLCSGCLRGLDARDEAAAAWDRGDEL